MGKKGWSPLLDPMPPDVLKDAVHEFRMGIGARRYLAAVGLIRES